MVKKNDFFTGIAVFAFSIFYVIKSFSIKVFKGTGATSINARTIPMIWGILLMFLSILLIVRSFVKKSSANELSEAEMNKKDDVCWKHKFSVPATLILILLFALLIKKLGFIIVSSFYMFFQMYFIGPIKIKRLWLLAVISVLCSVLIYFVFVHFLNVPLPGGLIKF